MSQSAHPALPFDTELFQQLAETSDVAFRFVRLAPERVLYVNPAFERIWGRPSESLLRAPQLWLEAIHANDRAAVEQALSRWLAGTRPSFDVEYRVLRPDGEIRWVFDQGTLVRSAAGTVERMCLLGRDITLRRQAEAALRESESRYRSVIEALSEGILIIDRQGVMWGCNTAAERILGVTREQMLGFNVMSESWGAIHEDGSPYEPKSFPIVRTVITGEPLQNVTMGLYRPSGELCWISINTQPIHEAGVEHPLAAVASFQDISDRKRVEQQVLRAHELVKASIEGSPEAMTVIDLEKRVQLWNRAAEETFGWRAEEVLGQPLPIVPPESQEAFEQGFIWQIEQGGTFKNQEAIRMRRDGSRVPVSLSTAPLRNAAGRVVSILGVLSDITERKAAEAARDESDARFRQLAEHIESVFWLLEWPSGKMLYVSPAYERIFGRSRQSLFDDPDSWVAAVHPDDRERVTKYFQDTLLSGAADQEYRVVHGPEVRWVRDRAFPVRDRNGQIYRVAGIASNITERRRYEEQLRQREAELAHVARVSTLGEMAAQLAHEMNQPLYAISNFSEAGLTMLQSSPPAKPDEVAVLLRRIQGLSQRAGEIVRRMQQFARRHEPESEVVDLNAIVTDTLALLDPLAERASVKLKPHLDKKLPPAWADPILIQQVLVNLVRNGIEAMEETLPAKRLLSVRTQTTGNRLLLVSVSDAGRGLPAGHETDVFEPFFTTKSEGLGMGLAICRSAIESHGGRLWTESAGPNQGTTFHFTLPMPPTEK